MHRVVPPVDDYASHVWYLLVDCFHYVVELVKFRREEALDLPGIRLVHERVDFEAAGAGVNRQLEINEHLAVGVAVEEPFDSALSGIVYVGAKRCQKPNCYRSQGVRPRLR